LDRSPARLQRLDDGRDHSGVRAAASPDRNAVDLNLDCPDIGLRLAPRRLALPANNRRLGDRINYRRHKLQFFLF
jgi:hypothetical protein